MSQQPAMSLVRQGVYQAAGGVLLAAGVGLVLVWLNPPPKTNENEKKPCGCNKTPTVYR